MSALEAAWTAAEVDGWEVVGLVRRLSRPPHLRWQAQVVHRRRLVYAFGPTAPEALLEVRRRVERIDALGAR